MMCIKHLYVVCYSYWSWWSLYRLCCHQMVQSSRVTCWRYKIRQVTSRNLCFSKLHFFLHPPPPKKKKKIWLSFKDSKKFQILTFRKLKKINSCHFNHFQKRRGTVALAGVLTQHESFDNNCGYLPSESMWTKLTADLQPPSYSCLSSKASKFPNF